MKKLILWALSLFLCVGCVKESEQVVENVSQKQNLRGKIKVIREFSFKASEKLGQFVKEKLQGEAYSIFDEKGNIVEETYYSNYKSIFKYDNKGNITEQHLYTGEGSYEGKYIYKYDEKGNITEEHEYKKEGNYGGKTIFKCDEKGNIIEEHEYKKEGNYERKFIFKYDEKGNRIEKHEYYSGYAGKTIYKYDEQQNIISEIDYDSKGALLRKKIHIYQKYDSHGNWTKKVFYKDVMYSNAIDSDEITIFEREITYYK
ncbi:hypothetical protein [Capnocytophaga canimorsus]|uniref:hypothetical protein n=1 Tax=Capnocytophaga canimorsus TaxID=28188 RepID=UPI0037CCC3B4